MKMNKTIWGEISTNCLKSTGKLLKQPDFMAKLNWHTAAVCTWMYLLILDKKTKIWTLPWKNTNDIDRWLQEAGKRKTEEFRLRQYSGERVCRGEPDAQLIFHSRYLSDFKAARGRRLRLSRKTQWRFWQYGGAEESKIIVQMNLFTEQKWSHRC